MVMPWLVRLTIHSVCRQEPVSEPVLVTIHCVCRQKRVRGGTGPAAGPDGQDSASHILHTLSTGQHPTQA